MRLKICDYHRFIHSLPLKLGLLIVCCLLATDVAFAQEKGKASYYSRRSTGAYTSSGRRFHSDSLFCAHRKYPFGTLLKVTNISNGKEVVVKVVDRGPFIKGRIIDLSYAAASKLGMISQGVGSVVVTPYKPNKGVPYKLEPQDELPEFDFETADDDGTTPAWITKSHPSMHVVILGDSNTWQGGDDCTKPKGWNKWFADYFKPASCRSYARSGATWTNTPKTRRNIQENIATLGDDNVIYNQVVRLDDAVGRGHQPSPQLILIMAGTNDAWFLDKRPHALEKTARQVFSAAEPLSSQQPSSMLTLAESIRYSCELLRRCFPKSQIVLIAPLQSVQAARHLNAVNQIIDDCAHEMNIGIIRLDTQSGITSTSENRTKRYTTDGTHTSVEGAKRCARCIASAVEELLKTKR
ncbi:MAG: septal ring lytic transglycosylase RlpA family protein [Prevotella sp.]|nr:septal ring lytic transglycosylase RlpA family protein [Prevotella sp.]